MGADDDLKLDEREVTVTREFLFELMYAFGAGQPVVCSAKELAAVVKMAVLSLDLSADLEEAVTLLRRVAKAEHKRRAKHITDVKRWIEKNVTPEAPCETPPSGEARPATPSKTGQANDAQPAGVTPMPKNLREAADRMADAAERFVESYKDHLDRCQPCTINWQLLRDSLAAYQSKRSYER